MKVAALVPAAGQSRRMGRPKLILPVDGQPVIARVVAALRDGGISTVVVVVPPLEEPGAVEVFQQAKMAGAFPLHCPAATAEMRETVQLGLDELDQQIPDYEGLVLTPGDSVGLTPSIVNQARNRFEELQGRSIVVAAYLGKRGHPLILPADLARTIRDLPKNQGVNALLAQHAERVVVQELAEAGVLADLDTPEDYQRWTESGKTPKGNPAAENHSR